MNLSEKRTHQIPKNRFSLEPLRKTHPPELKKQVFALDSSKNGPTRAKETGFRLRLFEKRIYLSAKNRFSPKPLRKNSAPAELQLRPRGPQKRPLVEVD